MHPFFFNEHVYILHNNAAYLLKNDYDLDWRFNTSFRNVSNGTQIFIINECVND